MLTIRGIPLVLVLALAGGCKHHSGNTNGGTDGGGGSSGGGGAAGSGNGDGGMTSCPTYQTLCNGVCIATTVDPDNCGGCGIVCSPTQACSAGACSSSCLPGLTICNRSCVDVTTDNGNCGVCGHACPPGQGCSGGSCVPTAPIGPAPTQCMGGGPPIVINNGGNATCTGNLAQTTFTWGLCSCTNVSSTSKLLVDAFDSTKGPYMPGGLGGGVGLDGALHATSEVDVFGAMWASASGGVTTTANTSVHQELHVGGPLSTQRFAVGGDGYVVGNITGAPLSFAGKLYQPASATISGSVTYSSLVHQPVTVAPPCECAADKIIPVAAIVAAHQTMNDNAAIGLAADLFTRPNSYQRLDLPCGQYYLDAIRPTGALAIVAHGHTALFVGGDIATTNTLVITLDPTATLDLFVAGTISTGAAFKLGSPNYPALSRAYVGGTQTLMFTSNVTLAGDLYAATAPLNWTSNTDAYGAIYAGNFTSTSDTAIHYDLQVLHAGSDCPMPADGGAPQCGSCSDCGNQACVGGTCGACTSNDQCCAPLVCSKGSCVPFIP